jgi:hypothetical protein
MYHIKYTPEEKLERIKLFMKYDSSKTLSEQMSKADELKAAQAYADYGNKSTTQVDNRSEEQKIADDFYNAAAGMGTSDQKMVDAVLKIKDPKQFWEIDSYLKTKPKKMDFSQIVNDEFEYNNFDEATEITDHLKKIGLGAEFQKLSTAGGTNRFGTNSFKITSAPIDVSSLGGVGDAITQGVKKATDAVKNAVDKVEKNKAVTTTSNIPTELKDVKDFQDWLDRNHPGEWHVKYQILGSDPNKGYGKFGPNTIRSWNKWKNDYLNQNIEPQKVTDVEGDQEQVYGDNPNDILAAN